MREWPKRVVRGARTSERRARDPEKGRAAVARRRPRFAKVDRLARKSKRFGYSGRITRAVAGVDRRPTARPFSHAAAKRDVRTEPPVLANRARRRS
jgi:hypothetical protein